MGDFSMSFVEDGVFYSTFHFFVVFIDFRERGKK